MKCQKVSEQKDGVYSTQHLTELETLIMHDVKNFSQLKFYQN